MGKEKTRTASPSPLRIHRTASLLTARYADFEHYNRHNPLEELLFIICSVQTQESGYRKTFKVLRRKFPRLEVMARATAAEIAKPLKPGGLYRNKSRQIKQILRRLIEEFGRPTLSPLSKMSDPGCEAFLTSLPGVGLKVARCVMMYSFRREVFPVDTHCWRISRRLGWIRQTRPGICTRKDMSRLQDKIPPALRLSLHVNTKYQSARISQVSSEMLRED
jgi:endonuclease III